MRRASWMSLGMMVTRLAWMAQRLVSSKRPSAWEQTDQDAEHTLKHFITNEVGFGGLLKREDSGALPPWNYTTHSEVLGDLLDEALERALADEELGPLLEAADLAEGDGTGAIAVGFLGEGEEHMNSQTGM